MNEQADTVPVPLYRSLAHRLRADLEREQIPPGGRLPSERTLAALHRVNRQTVRQALQYLREQGIVSTDKSGTYVPAAPAEAVTVPVAGDLVFPGGVIPVGLATPSAPDLTYEPAPTDVAESLQLRHGARTMVHRQRLTDPIEGVVQTATSYFSSVAITEVPQLAKRRRQLRRGTRCDLRRLYQWMLEAGLRPVRSETLTLVPPRTVAESADTPAQLRIRRLVCDQYERPLEVTDLTVPAGSWQLSYRFALSVPSVAG
ncbi:GntR family transcriptional regulator [Streptomyces sp. NPDC055287]